MTERDDKIIARIKELEELPTARVVEAGYAVLVKLPNTESEELRAVLQVLWTKTFYKEDGQNPSQKAGN
jgi:hypothetical protein